jgi:hypothetical protein
VMSAFSATGDAGSRLWPITNIYSPARETGESRQGEESRQGDRGQAGYVEIPKNLDARYNVAIQCVVPMLWEQIRDSGALL